MTRVTKKNKGLSKDIINMGKDLAIDTAMSQVPRVIRPYVERKVNSAVNYVLDKFYPKMPASRGVGHPGAGKGAVAAPVAISRRMSNVRPRFSSSAGSVVVTHREYLTDVVNTSSVFLPLNGFTIPGLLRINPTNGVVFPWLSTIAANYDMYRLKAMRVRYNPACATSEAGKVWIYWDKDSSDPIADDKAAVYSAQHGSEGPLWGECELRIPTDSTWRFVQDSSAVQDRKLIDCGQIVFGTYGGTNSAVVGDLFVEYQIELKEAQPTGQLGTFGTLTSAVGPIGTITSFSASGLNLQILPPGLYKVVGFIVASGTSVVAAASGSHSIQPNGRAGSDGSNAYFEFDVLVSGLRTGNFTISVSGSTRYNFFINKITTASLFTP